MIKPKNAIKVGISLGDYNGIGPELALRVLEDPRITQLMIPIIYGSGRILQHYRRLVSGVERFSFQTITDPQQATPGKIWLIECLQNPERERVEPGKASEHAGRAAFQFLSIAVKHLKEGKIDTLCTLPIDKATIQQKEFNFPGHTEYLTHQFSASDALMIMVEEELRLATVTSHIPLKEVSSQISADKIYNKLKLFSYSLQVDFNIDKPKIAVLGLNPHAGDGGLLGKEEKEKVEVGIEKARKEGLRILGPYAADGFFAHGLFRQFDGILAMYHDQGLIPFKLLAEGKGVNYTAGLPVIRTSPDHGTAYDLAGKTIADLDSFRHALFLSLDVFQTRNENLTLRSGALKAKVPAELMREDEVAPLNKE
ncbi:MAG: 4-hydroxythreonine-4-phosphate dehydrogenase PdxA [Sphingobacteriia bacterium]|nr:4-hydroxythreonine-4-phosphate dehydrogenase PdxA [Sphingobacteriia bacterium]